MTGTAGAPSTGGAAGVTSAPTAGTGTPTTGAGAVSSPTTETVNPGSWMAGFNDDLKGYISNKGFKGPSDVADAYRNLEKLMGAPKDRLMTLPEQFYDDKGKLTPEGKSVYERLGAPKEAKDYNLQAPKDGGDPKLMEHFSNVFLEAGVPKAAAEKIVNSWNEFQASQVNAMKEQAKAAFTQAEGNLRKEWGAAYDQNVNIAKEAVRTMGIDAKAVEAMSSSLGHEATMKFFKDLGKKVGESPFITGSGGSGVLEPASAQAKIKELRADRDFGARLMKGDVEAKTRWENLHKQAYPGQFNI